MKKNQKTLLKLSCLVISSLLFFNSCQSDNEIQTQSKTDSHLISQEDAIKIAENLTVTGRISSQTSKGSRIKKAGYTFTRFTQKKDAAFYIINYENGGFAIVSADDRNTPVLAYSENSVFQNDTVNYPEGLKMWLAFQTQNIETIKFKNLAQSAINKTEWSAASKIISGGSATAKKIIPFDPKTCPEDQIEQVGPLLTTTWGQWGGYNNLAPLLCSANSSGRAPTGCVATAMAQVMKYHQKPASYNWANMPNNYGTPSTAGLMLDIGYAVNMSYGCDGSSADSYDQVASSFVNDFHYSNAARGTYNYQTVVSQISARRPVILSGGRKKDGISFDMYADGHAWVCDGYIRSSSYYYDESQGSCLGVGMLSLHMNWGWSGSYDGWYSFNNFNPSTYSFNYEAKMYYNIIP
ncbi:C10 family peptidase [Flavobacterium sp. 17A]|uniref:C10 family peptidase n=1 Tax=Flavobacterium potami TaxID=2872310 RepID=A0A9X1HE34_9FLAO|nr:C10 family peptidase [Flavobacterium potami]MBZ4037141.1 C10 family peptidase [Flavobacterium potami]